MALLYIDEHDVRKAHGVFYVTPRGGWIGGDALRTCEPEHLAQMAEHADILAEAVGSTPARIVTTVCEEGFAFLGDESLFPFSWKQRR